MSKIKKLESFEEKKIMFDQVVEMTFDSYNAFKDKSNIQLYKAGKDLSDVNNLDTYEINKFLMKANLIYGWGSAPHIDKISDILKKNKDTVFKDYYLNKTKAFHKFINKDELDKFINNYFLNIFQFKGNYHKSISLINNFNDLVDLKNFCIEKMNNPAYNNFSIIHVPNEVIENECFRRLLMETVEMAHLASEDIDSSDSSRYLRMFGQKAFVFLKEDSTPITDRYLKKEFANPQSYNMEMIRVMSAKLNEIYLTNHLNQSEDETKLSNVKKEQYKRMKV